MKSANAKLDNGKEPSVYPLEGKKAERYRTDSMLIPTPLQVREAIRQVPPGQTLTLVELRQRLADASGAGVTCPLCAGIFWRLVAEAAEEDRAEGKPVSPWWRITKDGKPNPKLPGGLENHRRLLAEEGVRI